MTVSMNNDCKDMKSNARPKRRNAYGEQLCHKAKLQWDEPVSFNYIPLVEEALNINIYVIDIDNLPGLGAAIELWDCLTYKSMDRGTTRHWLLMDGDHYNVITNITGFLAVRGMCDKWFKCFYQTKEIQYGFYM